MSRSRVYVVLLACSVAACGARAETRLPAGDPPLVPPTPPARVIVPAPESPTLPPVEEPPASTTSPATSRPSQSSNSASRPPVTTPPSNPPVENTPPVRLMSTANAAEFEKRIRGQMGRAETDLAQINRQSLGPDARAQFDAARGFLRQAGDALKVRNLHFASQLADKAATLAAMLRRTPAA